MQAFSYNLQTHVSGQMLAGQSSSRASQRAAAAPAASQSATVCSRRIAPRLPQPQHRVQQRSLLLCHATKKQQPSKDKPDMGRRSSRQTKIPTLDEFVNPSDPKTPDPDSRGFQERALLMAYMESLDPSMRKQFEQYMNMQMQQMEDKAEVGYAADYMQRVMDQYGDRAGISADNFDADKYVSSKEGQDILWQSLREQFSTEEQDLLDSVLGRDWQSFGEKGLTPEAIQKISSLNEDEWVMLSNLLSRMSDMNKSMDVLIDRATEADKPSSSSSSRPSSSSSRPSGSSSSSGVKSSDAWGSSFRRKKSARVRSKETEAAEQYWDKFLDGEMTNKVQKMMLYASQAMQGKLTWGRPPSSHFITLKQAYTEMVQLEGLQLREPDKMSQEELAQAYARINYTLNNLVSQLDNVGGDTATRSALLYMDAIFNSSSSGGCAAASSSSSGGSSSSSSGSSNNSDVNPSSSTRASASSSGGSSGDTPGSSSDEQRQQGVVNLEKLQKLGRFLKAAENLDAYQTWLTVFSEKHPEITSTDMLMIANLGGDDWFLKPQQQAEALAAAQAAAQAAAGGSSSTGGGAVQSAISGALLPYIDDERIDALATLDASTLWFLTELEANNYSEDVIMKWSLHPEISQKLLKGNWFDELEMSDSIRKVYLQAQRPDFMSALNFDLQ